LWDALPTAKRGLYADGADSEKRFPGKTARRASRGIGRIECSTG
jgi:hypothetical protein